MGNLAPTIAMVAALAAGVALSMDRATAIGPAAKPGMPAPAVTAPDITGKTVSLRDFAGKFVILEWTNDGCPSMSASTCRH